MNIDVNICTYIHTLGSAHWEPSKNDTPITISIPKAPLTSRYHFPLKGTKLLREVTDSSTLGNLSVMPERMEMLKYW